MKPVDPFDPGETVEWEPPDTLLAAERLWRRANVILLESGMHVEYIAAFLEAFRKGRTPEEADFHACTEWDV